MATNHTDTLRTMYFERKQYAYTLLNSMARSERIPRSELDAAVSILHQLADAASTFDETGLGEKLRTCEYALRTVASGEARALVSGACRLIAPNARDGFAGASNSDVENFTADAGGIYAPQRDRRSEQRYQSVYIPASIACGEEKAFGVVRNISRHGARLRAPISVEVGDCIVYSVDEKRPIESTVKWVNGDDFGVFHLDEALRVPVARPDDYRAVRVAHQVPIIFYLNGLRHEGILRNLSQGGACIEASRQILPGERATVLVGGQQFENVTVRWQKNGCFGVEWSRSLRTAELNEIVNSMQVSVRPASASQKS
ncbi:PilZ domain-containing protein [Tsuneonella flava]|uniref:PilZ domain-containing protein n=1 Tax=Tsuneonella flava TaxID=2055955 RepID=A0ABX7KAQ5_9SPHN|nr:PilZ domain-containing protein [Tsuneonella flava]QSB45345.1 PilZ domain-containing protein [Tsuneonella flava]